METDTWSGLFYKADFKFQITAGWGLKSQSSDSSKFEIACQGKSDFEAFVTFCSYSQ